MFKNTATFVLALLLSVPQAIAAEQWECALDLQQGDKGSMSLDRDGNTLTGSIKISRNDNTFSQDLEGRWDGREIELKRFINAGSNQAMHGIAIRVGAQQVKMGGRYAEGLNGVWSADCDLVSTSVNDSTDVNEELVTPSISARVLPSRPSSREAISISAQAFHPDGIESVTFYVDDKAVHRCDSDVCSTKYGPLTAGSYEWHVIAKSKTGTENEKRGNSMTVVGATKQGSCKISGLATGPAVSQSGAVTLTLIGDDIDKSARFEGGTYSFGSVAPGNYQLTILSPENFGVLVSPASVRISCPAERAVEQNFDFR